MLTIRITPQMGVFQQPASARQHANRSKMDNNTRRCAMKPVVLVTRKLPTAVEDRLRRDYQPRLNVDDHLYSRDELLRECCRC